VWKQSPWLYNSIHVAKNYLQNTFQSMENQGNTLKEAFYIIEYLSLSSPKVDCRNETTTSKQCENSCFDFYNSIHVARNNSHDTFNLQKINDIL